MTYPSGFGASLVVSDKSTTGTATLTLTGYASTEIVSVNVIMYFDVGLGSIGKNALCGWMWNVAGNIMTANIAATLEYTSSTSISSYYNINLGLPLGTKSIYHLTTLIWWVDSLLLPLQMN